MIDFIKTEQAYNQFQVETEDNFVKSLLVNEIRDVEINYHIIKKQQKHSFRPLNRRVRVILILSNSGIVYSDQHSHKLKEIAIMTQLDNYDITIESIGAPVELIEIIMDMTTDDLEIINNSDKDKLYFVHYSECATYKEKIKSTKTVNRTLLPENIIPRMVIGSVQTEGPDQIGAHSHPMLEQLFWGFPCNNCLVKADKYEKDFGERTLLHIPLGSEHSVAVKEGKSLHYIWMDFFNDLESVSYIENTHISNTK